MTSRERYNVFDNPMIDSAKKALTPEQQESYRIMGEHMFSVTQNDEKKPDAKKEMLDLIVYTREALKAGLDPNDLKSKEVQVMYEVYGERWFEEFGYTESEVPINPSLVKVEPVLTKKQVRNNIKKENKRKNKK